MGSPSGSGRMEVNRGMAAGLEAFAADVTSTPLPVTTAASGGVETGGGTDKEAITGNTAIWTAAIGGTAISFVEGRFIFNLRGIGTLTAGTKTIGASDQAALEIPAAAEVVTVTFNDGLGADDIAGTGAQKVVVVGVDGNWTLIAEEVDTAAFGTANTTATFLLPLYMYVSQAGSGAINSGQIVATDQAPVGWNMTMQEGDGDTRHGFFPVPAGYTAVIKSFDVENAASEAWEIRVINENDLRSIPLEGTDIAAAFDGGIRVGEKSLIQAVVTSGSGGAYECAMDIELLLNPT